MVLGIFQLYRFTNVFFYIFVLVYLKIFRFPWEDICFCLLQDESVPFWSSSATYHTSHGKFKLNPWPNFLNNRIRESFAPHHYFVIKNTIAIWDKFFLFRDQAGPSPTCPRSASTGGHQLIPPEACLQENQEWRKNSAGLGTFFLTRDPVGINRWSEWSEKRKK